MNDMPRYSVCIATFNGEKYIQQQVRSILSQLTDNDEIIVSDDSSSDNTLTLIKELADPRIKIYPDQRFQSPIYNFEFCLSKAEGDIIFLSDQDDIWLPGKVDRIIEAFRCYNCDVVVSDAMIVDEHLNILHESFFGSIKSGPGILKNIYKNTYLGCTMAVHHRILDKALPFPRNIPMHDMWIGLIGELFGKTRFIDNKLVLYRRHAETVTTGKHATTIQMIKWRINLTANLLLRYFKLLYQNMIVYVYKS